MGPRFVNVEYLYCAVRRRKMRLVSMGPRFVNVEYKHHARNCAIVQTGFNGATFCERGILPDGHLRICFLLGFNGATFCERGIRVHAASHLWLWCCFNGATFCERGIPLIRELGGEPDVEFQWGHVL